MKQHEGNVGANFHYLLLKECRNEIDKYNSEIKQIIRDNVDEKNAIDLGNDPKEEQIKVYTFLLQQIKGTEWGEKLVRKMKDKILEKSKNLYEFGSQRNYFLIENFRESTQYPLVKTQSPQCFNLLPLYKNKINKELRRVLWQRCLLTESYKQQFFTYDHKVSPYNIKDQLLIGINRLAVESDIKIRENQKDTALRLLDYTVKKWNRIPNNSEQNLTLCVVELFSHYAPTKMHELGSIYVGLIDMAQYYFEPDLDARINNIIMAFELVDADTFNILKKDYAAQNEKKLFASLNEIFQHFRMTMSCAYLPVSGAQFIIDQLLIKKKNKFDIYVLHAILFMIMSDDLEEYKQAQIPILQIMNPEKTKRTIKQEDVVDAFRVIYESVPPYHVGTNLPQTNKLLDELLRFDQQQEQINKKQQKEEVGISEEQLVKFVRQDKRQVLRLGNLMS